MKNYSSNHLYELTQKASTQSKSSTKFVYSKQKFSSPQFFFNTPTTTLNQNIFSGIFSPQPNKINPLKSSSSPYQTTAENNKFSKNSPSNHKINHLSTINEEPKTLNDSLHLTKGKFPQRQNIWQKETKNQKEINRYQNQKDTNLRQHHRIVSQPNIFQKTQRNVMNQEIHKSVRFNEDKIKTSLANMKRQMRKRLEKSTSSSILKNKHKKGRVVSVDDTMKRKRTKFNDSDSLASDDVKEDFMEKTDHANAQIRKKYENIMGNLMSKVKNSRMSSEVRKVKESDKFTDGQFPGKDSSVFGYNTLVKIKEGKLPQQNVKWVRIPQLFPNHKLIVFDKSSEHGSSINILPSLHGSVDLAAALNAVKNCKSFLGQIFSSQTCNQFGIYMLKIYTENIWKYIIIDDKIPVIELKPLLDQNISPEKGSASFTPAFLNVQIPKSETQIQMWPFLLEKAYASYYSNYQTFHIGNSLDYLQEITGLSSLPFDLNNLNDSNQVLKCFQREFKSPQTLGLGQKPNYQTWYPLFPGIFNSSRNQRNLLSYCDPKNNFKTNSISFHKIPFQFSTIHAISFNKYPHMTHTFVGHYKKGKLSLNPNKNQRTQYSVRSLNLEEDSNVIFSIKQKEKRFYENSSFKYEYIWIRVILVQREFNGEYRWIAGKYSSQKSINLQAFLTKGLYFFIIMPEWKHTHCHELNVFLWSSVPNLKLIKETYDPEERMIEKGSMDLAQRKGKLSQVNAFICSYNYLNEDVGMIIENINNERTSGSVKVMRSINGLKASVEIIPVNKEFYELNDSEKRNLQKKFKNSISINIPQESSFTVVLKMKGGIDSKFFQVFDFGN